MNFLAAVFLIFSLALSAQAGILTTKHNLSSTGPGAYKAATETQVCVFCHVPHGADPARPLWNHSSTVQSFTPYDQSVSRTLRSNPGQPDGASKLCLGCHDGTIAVGSTVAGGTISGLSGTIAGSSLLGTNLANSHPVSFVYNNTLAAQRGELVDPAGLPPAVKLDDESKLQCISCHDPHEDANGKFLVMANTGGALCSACHNKSGWSNAVHRSVLSAGCNTCHKPHSAGVVPLLSADYASLCGSCHNSVVSQFRGTSLFGGAGAAGSYTTVNTHHDIASADQTYSGAKITCGSCHNPHAVRPRSGSGAALENLIDPFNRNNLWAGGAASDYRGSITNFCLTCHGGTFPPSVSNPLQTVAPSSAITNISTAYQTDRHGHGSRRPTANNSSPAVAAMACTACHGPHGSHYSDQTWDGNVYQFKDIVDGTGYADNGAEYGPPLNWPYLAPTSATGVSKSVRVSPNRINTAGDANNLNNLCSACHSRTSGPGGASHSSSSSSCTNCHHHGNPAASGGL